MYFFVIQDGACQPCSTSVLGHESTADYVWYWRAILHWKGVVHRIMVMDRHRVQRSVFLFHIQFRVTCTIMYNTFVYFTKKAMQSTRVSKLCHCAKKLPAVWVCRTNVADARWQTDCSCKKGKRNGSNLCVKWCSRKLYTVSKRKHVTLHSFVNLTYIVRFQQFVAQQNSAALQFGPSHAGHQANAASVHQSHELSSARAAAACFSSHLCS